MNTIKTLTVYLGSSGHARPVFRESATKLGALIGEGGYKLVYGGMDAGLMGLIALSALENGAHVTGIIPRKLKDSERILSNLNETVMVEDLWDRKKRMFKQADAIVSLPGGYGTLDESLEMLYWAKLNLHNKPLVLVNVEGYWNDLVQYLHTLPDFDDRYLIVVDTPEEVIPALEAYEVLPSVEETDRYPHFEDEICRETAEPIVVDKASVENSYYVICALGLKQLHKHKRPIGFLNTDGQFDGLLKWINTAAEEKFITQNCLKLFNAGTDLTKLRETLHNQEYVEVDLHNAKWGPPEEK